MNIGMDSVVARNEDIFAGQIDDELVMVSIDSGNYYVLNLTARRIWDLLESPLSISEICDKLMEEFEIDPQTCQAEVLRFAEKLFKKQIVTIT